MPSLVTTTTLTVRWALVTPCLAPHAEPHPQVEAYSYVNLSVMADSKQRPVTLQARRRRVGVPDADRGRITIRTEHQTTNPTPVPHSLQVGHRITTTEGVLTS